MGTILRDKVNSIADLKALINIPIGKVIETDSYYGDNEGISGSVFVKVTDTGQTPNDGTIIRGTDLSIYEALDQTKGDLLQFGFVGDGTAVDWGKLHLAMTILPHITATNIGYTYQIPYGLFFGDETGNNKFFEGIGVPKFEWEDGHDFFAVDTTYQKSTVLFFISAEEIIVSGIHLNGRRYDFYQDVIDGGGNVSQHAWGFQIRTQAKQVKVTNCISQDQMGDDIYFGFGAFDCKAFGNIFVRPARSNIVFTNCDNIHVFDNLCYVCRNGFIDSEPNSGQRAEGIYADNNTYYNTDENIADNLKLSVIPTDTASFYLKDGANEWVYGTGTALQVSGSTDTYTEISYNRNLIYQSHNLLLIALKADVGVVRDNTFFVSNFVESMIFSGASASETRKNLLLANKFINNGDSGKSLGLFIELVNSDYLTITNNTFENINGAIQIGTSKKNVIFSNNTVTWVTGATTTEGNIVSLSSGGSVIADSNDFYHPDSIDKIISISNGQSITVSNLISNIVGDLFISGFQSNISNITHSGGILTSSDDLKISNIEISGDFTCRGSMDSVLVSNINACDFLTGGAAGTNIGILKISNSIFSGKILLNLTVSEYEITDTNFTTFQINTDSIFDFINIKDCNFNSITYGGDANRSCEYIKIEGNYMDALTLDAVSMSGVSAKNIYIQENIIKNADNVFTLDSPFGSEGNLVIDNNTYENVTTITPSTAYTNINRDSDNPSLNTGTEIDLSNAKSTPYNTASAIADVVYTTINEVTSGNAYCLINTASEPTVTGGTKISGATWTISTDMYLVVQYNGTRVEFYFLEI